MFTQAKPSFASDSFIADKIGDIENHTDLFPDGSKFGDLHQYNRLGMLVYQCICQESLNMVFSDPQ